MLGLGKVKFGAFMRNSQFFQRRFWLQRYRVSENPFFHELIPALTSPFLDRTTTYWSGHDDTPSGSSTVELLIGYESEHKHYLNVSAATNLFVNLIGCRFDIGILVIVHRG
ncbi:hypothetical protein KIW84_053431 [Lathyrus oleraceus]|uniref:Uncharacterized protein n=1 Tax=Pisum sativum TaxID=3888 RepID=A0A9D4WT76_PEA|nr:hypothetical protein KIW84_053431 [Pisum sativum]